MHANAPTDKKGHQSWHGGLTPPLSEESLQQHILAPSTSDSTLAERLIRIEAALMSERAAFEQCSLRDGGTQPFMLHDESSSSSDSVDNLLRLSSTYRNEQNSATPMERFATLSWANDPCAWESRRVMAELRLREGSLETAKIRSNAAAVVAAEGRKKVATTAVATSGTAR